MEYGFSSYLARVFETAARGAAWGRRRLHATLAGTQALLIYHDDYRLPENPLFDVQRAEKILGYLVDTGCASKKLLREPPPLEMEALTWVHTYAYLESLDNEETLVRIFGQDVRQMNSELIVAAQRSMVAGTVLAAEQALAPESVQLAVNLGGGLHHAGRDHGAGFCLFNDVAVAIYKLRKDGFDGRVLVVDLDLHQGDGTRAIFADDESVHTFSVHAEAWDTARARANRDVELQAGVGDETYLAALHRHLPGVFAETDPALIFYVAGVDVARDDRLGSWRVSSDAILQRDRLLIRLAAGRPLVWTLAGGYGDEAWRHTARSLAWFLCGDDAPIPSGGQQALARARRIARRLTRAELSGSGQEDLILTPAELMSDLVGPSRRAKLLGYYTKTGIETALERYDILPHIRRAGYPSLQVTLDTEYPTGQLLRIYSRPHDGHPRYLLVELVLRESRQYPPYRLLAVEWLLMQDPKAAVHPGRPLLPGQRYPGLGALKKLFLMLVMACERLELDGLQFCPSHYHVAAQARGTLAFLDPHDAAFFAAIEAALTGLPLARATAVVHRGGLVDRASGEVVKWRAAPMVLPVSTRLSSWVNSADYQKKLEAASQTLSFVIVPPR
jgi:acetoin utilization deacetylase AcuC-like enzyme